MIEVPKGIAHFLEHKVFEQEDGTDPFDFFSERGASANANTTFLRTTYHFSGTKFFEENLDFLQSFVENPYFTDENIEKEKGIIEQEINMYLDNPYSQLRNGIMENLIVSHPMRIPVIGTVDSIRSITKEDLYTCYNTFYHPSNMIITVTGNVDANNVINLIKDHQYKRNIDGAPNIEKKKYDEPDYVSKEFEEKNMNISIPHFTLGYKINLEKIKNIKLEDILSYLKIAINIHIDSTSILNEKLVDSGVITSASSVSIDSIDNKYALVFISNATEKPKEVIENIKEELKDLHITEQDLKRRIKSYISNWISRTDDIYSMNNYVYNNIIDFNRHNVNRRQELEKFNIETLNYILDNINLDNSSIFIINPEK